MSEQKQQVLVFSENQSALQELLSKGREIASNSGIECVAIVLDKREKEELNQLGGWGANKVVVVEDPYLENFNAEACTDAIASVVSQLTPKMLIIGGTKRDMELAARLSGRLNVPCISHCTDFTVDKDSGQVEVKAMAYSGLGVATYHCKSPLVLGNVEPGTFKEEAIEGDSAEVIELKAEIKAPRVSTVQIQAKIVQGEKIENATTVVDIGSGVREKADLDMMANLAGLLGGQMACSRPVSADREWFPHFLGISSKKVSPELCISIGVSGAIQHMVGIRGSKVIVAINSDEDAAIFSQADYGILGDLYEIIPALSEAISGNR